MTTIFLLGLGAILLLGFAFWFIPAMRAWWKARGTRLVNCPENGQVAAIEIDSAYAARTAMDGMPLNHIRQCSRWPEKAGCGQDCLFEVEAAANGCKLASMLGEWYADKDCVFCRKPIGPINWSEHKPAFRDEEGRTLGWEDIAPSAMPGAMARYDAVCWDCHVTETFRRLHPELVIERKSRW